MNTNNITPQEFFTSSDQFGSDNHSGVHPDIMQAIVKANYGHAHSYGGDEYTQSVIDKMKLHFGSKSQIFFVFNGTAANVLSLSCITESYNSVLLSEHAHLWVDECGAPEKLLGIKLIPVLSPDAKIYPEKLEAYIIRRGDQHYSQVSAISITQPTEYGTCYTIKELKQLATWAKSQKLYIHMDGARLVNASYHLGCSLKELCLDIGIDVLSLGGTKNGLLGGEAVVILNPECAQNFKFRRKQFMQLTSKSRFIAAQFDVWLNQGLYKDIAKNSVDMAKYLAQELVKLDLVQITQKVESNVVFAVFPKKIIHELKKEHFFYIWNEFTFEARLMTSFDTTKQDIDKFISKCKNLLENI